MKLSTPNSFTLKHIVSLAELLLFLALSMATTPAQQKEPEHLNQLDVKDLAIGVSTERKITQQGLHAYSIFLKQGEVVRVSIKEKGVDVAVVFISVLGEQKMSAGSNQGTGFMRESVTLIAPSEAWYALLVRAEPVTDQNVSAGYDLLATRDEQASRAHSERARAELLLEQGTLAQQSIDDQSRAAAEAKGIEARDIWRSLGDDYWEAMSEVLIGTTQIYSATPAKGVANLKNALQTFERLNDEPAIAHVCMALATIYLTTNEQEQANVYVNRVLTIARKLGDKRIESLTAMFASSNLMGVFAKHPNNNYAEEISRARAKHDEHAEAVIWANHILRNGLDDEQLDSSARRALFEQAEREALPLVRKLKQRDLELHLLMGLAVGLYDDEAEDETVNERSLQYVCQAIVLAQIQNNRAMQVAGYLHLNIFYTGENDPLAVFFGKKAVEAVQEMRDVFRIGDRELQQLAAKQLEDGLSGLADDLIDEGRFAEALQIMNRVRDQEFFDFRLLKSPIAKLTLTPREAESAAAVDAAINRAAAKYAGVVGPEFAAAGSELRNLLKRLDQTFAGPKEVATNVSDVTELQSAMRELSAATRQKHVAIFLDGDVHNLLLVTPESIKGFSRPFTVPRNPEWSKDPIPEFLRDLRSPRSDPRISGAKLYRKIFMKRELGSKGQTTNTLEAELARYQPNVLHWSIGGNLRYVPLAALYDPAAKQYLVEKYQNVVFTRSRKERFLTAPKSWAAGIGLGTSVAYEGFPALPGVVEELAMIFGDAAKSQQGMLKGQVFLNKSFTRESLLSIALANPAVVHIASHFKFQPGDSRNSFLLLGDGNRVSLFDMQQTMTLFAGVDLITLSACETAAQQSDAKGKEVDGFAELAQRLGASSVIATLWKISDGATAKLMPDFYQLRMQNPDAPKSEILQRAQVNLLRRGVNSQTRPREVRGTGEENAAGATFAHPYYWAAFVLYGSSR